MTRIVAVVVALLAAEALAVPACPKMFGVFPRSRSGVPTNVEFQVTLTVGPMPQFQLFLGDQGVPVEQLAHGDLNWVTVRPLVPLTPRMEYALRSDDGSFVATYVIGDAADETPPAARALTRTTRRFASDVGGKYESVNLEIAGQADEQTAILVFSGDSTSSIQDAASAFTETGLLEDGRCARTFPLQASPNLALAVRVVDVAGNVSELSQPKQAKSGGCSSAPALLGVLGGIAMLLRRRTRD